MPLPKRQNGESADDFIARCMADEVTTRDFPDSEQRFAVCRSLLNEGESASIPETPSCWHSHLGFYAINPDWMREAVAMVKAGTIQETAPKAEIDADLQVIESGIAVINISGQMQKGESKFGGTSTVATRKELRAAARSEDVAEILLLIDSPGGTVAGTKELADDIAAANAIKPVVAQFIDMTASAALWVGVHAGEVFANRMAQVGSIGVFAVVEDSSGKMEREGIKVHVVSTGPLKGAMVEGTEITKEHLAELQKSVDEFSEIFVESVANGRGIDVSDVAAVADGRMMPSVEAVKVGLVDAVQSLDQTIMHMQSRINEKVRSRRQSAAVKRFAKACAES